MAEPSGEGTPAGTSSPPDAADAIEAATGMASLIADHLESFGDEPWVGVRFEDGGELASSGPLGATLYDGYAGLTFAFTGMSGLTDDDRFHHIRDAAVVRLRRSIEGVPLGIGMLSGAAGVLYASYYAWDATGSDDALWCLQRASATIVKRVQSGQVSDDLDLAGGEAGALLALVLLIEHDVFSGDALQGTARTLIDVLLERAERRPEGTVWPIWGEHIPLVGLGHGSSGIALALSRAAGCLGHRVDEVETVIGEVIEYEDATLDASRGTWVDPRYPDHPDQLNTWCYGAAGVRTVRALADRPVPRACASPAALDVRPVDHLCCGTAGRLVASVVAEHPDAPTLADGLIGRWRAGSIRLDQEAISTEATGLFIGLPGIAHALLLYAMPGSIANPLVLD